MHKRVVVTGMGVVSPNGIGIPAFLRALQNGASGIKIIPQYRELNFSCHVAGMPDFRWETLANYLSEVTLHGLRGTNIGYGLVAAMDAWADSGMEYETEKTRWETGCVFGNSTADTQAMKNVISRVDGKEARKLGSRVIEQAMNSGVTSYVSGRLGLGNKIITNSAACATGTQAILMGYEYIKHGYADRMLVGSTEHVDPYMYGAFDSMRVLSRKYNDQPEKASRPMSMTAGGFVPGSGAAALVLEDLDFARKRGAKIYAEVLGGATNSGGQRSGGTMTAANSEGVTRCVQSALKDANIDPKQIDLVSGHLTATNADKQEIQNWRDALGCKNGHLPTTNSLKSMIGHCLSAAGSIETVASILQIMHNFAHPNINLDDPNPQILDIAGVDNLPVKMTEKEINIVAKANFGFGDVNSCLILSKFKA
ncbi:MAG TPA: beta-ketoacyl-[acyl-carrier-protein] synthase family protein [Mucilaginibacter sp.]|jgi:3-oxoacyl-(acyl-carrier-protein) synthase|nr:beta-ketoacyl-[acyl-carrier-protein] synthase family protein [Mucilaginibacter sp.]